MKDKKSSHKIKGSSKLFGSIFISIMLLLMLSSVAVALDVTSPPAEELVVGDLISISGSATPNSEIEVCTMYTVTEDVKNGEYEYVLNNIRVPSDTDTFTVEAEMVNDLVITVQKFGIPLKVSTDADEESKVASITQSMVPPSTYKVTISGQSDEESVDITMEAISIIDVDNEGNFECSYMTSKVPAGEFTIEMKDDLGDTKEYTVTLLTHSEANSQNSNKQSSSNTGTELKIITAEERAQASEDNGNTDVGEGDNSGEDEPEEQLESPVDGAEGPAQEGDTPVEDMSSGPQETVYTKMFGWLKGLFS